MQSSKHKKLPIFIVFALSYLNNYLYYHNKILTTTVDFKRLSSASYRNGILHADWKILATIELSAICAQIVDFCRLGH